MNLKSEKGAITLIVLVSFMFFIASVVCAQMYTGSKRASVDKEYKQVKANYEKDIENMDEIYNNLSQIDNLEVAFNDVSVNTQERKISVSISTYLLNLDIKTMKYGWLYSENTIANPNSQNITDWTFVEISEGTNKIIANKTYKETEADGFYYLCFMVNNKEFWMEDPITTGYINDGLILHLDAINNLGLGDSNHSTTTTTWKDLSGNGNDGTVYNINNTAESGWHDKYISLDGVDDYVAKSEITVNGDNGTVEIVAKYISGSYMFRSNSSGARTYVYGDRTTKGEPPVSVTFNTRTRNNIASRVLKYYTTNGKSYTLNYYNMNKSEEKEYTGIGNGNYVAIGSFRNDQPDQLAKEDVYAVRVYNRALTEDEIRQNYLMDKIRFNIEE